jgi:hypothetical protein
MTAKFAIFTGLFRSAAPRPINVGAPLDVSSNGTTSVPPEALARVLRARFAELKATDVAADAGPENREPVAQE